MNEKTMKTVKTWSANEKQKQFMDLLKNYENGAFLSDIEIDFGVKFATGTINTLIAHDLVKVVDSVRVSEVFYRGVKITEKKDKVKRYYLK